jgi:hypothetical protein
MITTEEISKFLQKLSTYALLFDLKKNEQFLIYYHYAFDEYPPCSGCAGDLENAIMRLKVLVNKQKESVEFIKAKQLMKYQMKKEVQYYSSSMNMMVTKFNCTDAIAEKILLENPANAMFFENVVPIAEEKIVNEFSHVVSFSLDSVEEDVADVMVNLTEKLSKREKRKKRTAL